jgi:hypothetical protein
MEGVHFPARPLDVYGIHARHADPGVFPTTTEGRGRTNSRFDIHATTVAVRLAQARDEYERAFRLVYDTYRAVGYAAENPFGIRYSPFFGLPESRTAIAASANHQVVGTVSLVADSAGGVPMETAFADEVNALRRAGRRVAEAVSIVVSNQCRVRTPAVYFALTRFIVQYARFRGIDDLVIAVNPRHERFYCNRLGFQLFGSRRSYQAVGDHPAIACRLPMESLNKANPALRELHLSRPVTIEQFLQPPMRLVDHAYFMRRMQKVDQADRWARRLAS